MHLLQLSSTDVAYGAAACLLASYGAACAVLQSVCRYSCPGRTQPSLGGLLGCEADIIQLDVMEVEL
eukprot:1776509-Rhodomonas_salina.1